MYMLEKEIKKEGHYVKKYFSAICVVMMVGILSFLCISCSDLNTPPDKNTVQQVFDDHYEEIMSLFSFMETSEYNHISISDASGTIFADFSHVQIQDNDVCNAIKHLLKKGPYLHISKIDKTVIMRQWTGLQDIGCGVLYSQNIEESIDVEFITELIPLSEEGWFYYISDYNAWRTGQRASID